MVDYSRSDKAFDSDVGPGEDRCYGEGCDRKRQWKRTGCSAYDYCRPELSPEEENEGRKNPPNSTNVCHKQAMTSFCRLTNRA